MKRALFALVAIGVPLLVAMFVAARLLPRLQPLLVEYVASNLSEAERQKIYDQVASLSGTLWDTSPEPLVGKLAKRGLRIEHKGAEVVTNNAGMRSRRRWGRKKGERVVCLGDSFVMGTGGREEDRWCDQLGKELGAETLAVGLGGWTIRQSATYLAHRLSEYEPDAVVVLVVANDVGPSTGVTGSGATTRWFSPEERDVGAGVWSNLAGQEFGWKNYSALNSGIGSVAAAQWDNATDALKELVRLQEARGGRIWVAVLNIPGGARGTFQELFAAKMAPVPVHETSFFSSAETRLPHDGHPNRAGHAILAAHLGAIMGAESMPPADARLSLDPIPPDPARVVRQQEEWIASLPARIDFGSMRPLQARSLLGGVFRGGEGLPWSSVRSGFLIRVPENATSLTLEIDVPDRVELHGGRIRADVNGEVVELRDGANRVSVAPGVVQVVVTSDRYFATMEDARQRSFRWVRAEAN